MTNLKRIVALLAILGGLSAGLSACDNTIRGIGEDLKETNDAVKDST